MDTIIFIGIIILLCVLAYFFFIYALPVILVVGAVIWVINKIRGTVNPQPTDIPDNPYDEIIGNRYSNPFDEETFQSRQSSPDVIDVEFTEHEDTTDDQE